jgi:chitinase
VDEQGNISVNEDEKKQLLELIQWKQSALAQGVNIHTLFSVGGWEEGSEPLSALAADPESRRNFATQARNFCQEHQFDGVDIDWEFPADQEEGKHFFLLMFDLYQELKESWDKRYLLTIAAPALPEDYKKINWSEVAPLVDRISVMTYDLHGPWKDPDNLVTNHQSALKPTIVGNPELNITAVLKYYVQHVPKEKLAVGIPLFFTTYADAKGGILPSHYGSVYSGPAKNPYVSYEEGELYYRDIVEDIKSGRAVGYWDPISVAFMAYYPQTAVFASGVNEEAIRRVAHFIIEQGFQGAKVWNFQGDTPDWQALRLMHQLLLND